jgi:uncharacterized protein
MAGIERICLSVNSSCNLRCGYCYFFLQPDRLPEPKTLTTDEIGTILDRIQAYSLRPEVDKRIKVNFVGSGEPLLAWPRIRDAVQSLAVRTPDHRLRFYTVTNGVLLTAEMVAEMKELELFPSVSLHGPAWLHDAERAHAGGGGSHHKVMRGIDLLRAADIPVAINTTLTRGIVDNLEAYLDFVVEQGFSKVIFDRLVDVPPEHEVSPTAFYDALRRSAEYIAARKLDGSLEIGNLEAYRRALTGKPDRVCTMFGSTCGAGYHNIIYLQREVYPCGRMFGRSEWRLGSFDEPLEHFVERMDEVVARQPAWVAQALQDGGPAGADCPLEPPGDHGEARTDFVRWYGELLGVAETYEDR